MVNRELEEPRPAVSQRALILLLLYFLNTLLVLDKIILSVLLEPIKAEFSLNDSQLGLLTGAAYALCLGVASIPFGIAVDRTNRRNLASACLAVWSGMTALCAMAPNYLVFLLARLGVGLGEAGGGPTSLSIISDLYEHKRRATAMAIFSLGSPTAALINLTLNTQIAHHFGWRGALVAAAVPGLLLALSIRLFTSEPERLNTRTQSAAEEAPPLKETLAFILSQRSLVWLLSGAAISYVVLAGVSSWNFSYIVRNFDVSLHEIGPYFGVAISAAGLIGTYLTGRVADYLGQKNEAWRCWVMALTTIGAISFGTVVFTTSSLTAAVLCTAGLATCATLWTAPGFALSQSLVRARMRGVTGSIIFLIANLIGYGLGPLLVGVFSDLYYATQGKDGLQFAILAVLSLDLIAVFCFYRAAGPLTEDLKKAQME